MIPARSALVGRIPVKLTRWGVASPQRLSVKGRDRFGLFVTSFVHRLDVPVRIHPSERELDALLTPRRLRTSIGTHTARLRGPGCDYADVRAMLPGDTGRSVNWRVTARCGEPWVTERHPERSADVVLFVDRFEAIGPSTDSTSQLAVRVAIAILDTHLGAHDRVGVLDVGRHVRWFRPRLGRTQQRRLVDALLETQLELAHVPPDVSVLPLRSLAPGTLVVAVSSLLDERPLGLLFELRARGYDVVLIEPAIGDRLRPAQDRTVGPLAERLWHLSRESRRQRFRDVGIPVVTWAEDEPLGATIALLHKAQEVRR